jgi:hypothetical protein
MAIEAARIVIKIDTDAPQATRKMRSLDGATRGSTDAAKGARSAFSALVSVGIAAFATRAATAMARVGGALLTAASDAEETLNKFNVTFQGINTEAEDTAQNLADSFGLAQTEARGLLANTGDLLTGFGFTRDRALQLSTQVQELAVDLASFTNFSGGAAGASEALTKALLGERESIKSLGIAITEADIARLAEEKGITGELDRQTKAALTLELAIQQSGNAIGDFARSQDSFANQQRIAQSAVQDLREELGQQLLPIATEMIGKFTGLVDRFANLDDGTKEIIATVAAAVTGVTALTAAVAALNGAMAFLAANPMTAVIAAAAAVAAGIGILIMRTETFDEKIQGVVDGLEEQRRAADEVIEPLEGLNEQQEIGEEAYNRLIEIYPDLADQIDGYATSVEEAKEAVEDLNRIEAQREFSEIISPLIKQLFDARAAVGFYRQEVADAEAAIGELSGAQERFGDSVLVDARERLREAKEQLAFFSGEAEMTEARIETVRAEFERLFASMEDTEEQAEDTAGAIGDGDGKGGLTGAVTTLNPELLKLKLLAMETAEAIDKTGESTAEFAGEIINLLPGLVNINENLSDLKEIPEPVAGAFAMVGDALSVLPEKVQQWGDITKVAAEKGSAALDEQMEKLEMLEQLQSDRSAAEQESAKETARVEAEKAAFIAELEAEQHAEWMARVEAEDAALMASAEAEAELRAQARERHQQEMEERAERLAAMKAEKAARIDAAEEAAEREAESWRRATDAANEAYRERTRERFDIAQTSAEAIFDVTSSFADRFIEDERKRAVAQKAIAIAESVILGALAVSRQLALGNIAGAITAGIVAAAQTAVIVAEPIPGAELGGSFVVPPGNNGDGALMRVNSGERVDVTPARASDSGGGMPSTVVVRIGEREFAAAVEDAFNRGGAQIRRQGAVRVRR